MAQSGGPHDTSEGSQPAADRSIGGPALTGSQDGGVRRGRVSDLDGHGDEAGGLFGDV